MTLRRRLLVGFALLALLNSLVALWIGAAVLTRSFRARADRSLIAALDSGQRQLQLELDDRIGRLRNATGELRAELARHAGGAADTELRDVAGRIGGAHGLDLLQILDADARVLSSLHWPSSYGIVDASISSWPADVRAGPGGARWVTLRGLLDDRNERVPAVVRGVRLELGPSAEHVYDAVVGVAVDSVRLARLGMTAGNTIGLRLSNRWHWPATPGADRLATLTRGVVTASEPRRVGLEGTTYRFVARELEGHADGAVLAAVAPETELRLALGDLRRGLGVAALAGLLLAALGASVFAARLTRPIEEAARAARRIASGELDVRLAEQGWSESRALAASFNTMSDQLQTERRRLGQVERIAAWRDVARRLAHEIGNVLSPIQLSVDAMRRAQTTRPERLEEVVAASGGVLAQELDRLRLLVREFSGFAKAPAPRRRPTNVNAIVHDAVRLEAKRTPTITMQLSDSAGIASLDADAVRGAVINLLRNAAQAAEPPPAIVVATMGDDDSVAILVEDDGPGIDPAVRDRLFTPYVSGRAGGTGLGLSIVLRTVTDHGGRVDVTTPAAGGTLFSIILPRRQPPAVPGSGEIASDEGA